jgi:hypothetical protein
MFAVVRRHRLSVAVLLASVALAMGAGEAWAAKPKAPKKAAEGASPLADVEREAYSLAAKPAKAKVGEHAALHVELKAKNGFHVNAEYPHKLTLEAVPAGLHIEKTELARGDAALDDGSLRFDVDAVAEKPGRYSVQAKLKTSVCDEKQCILKSEKVTLKLVAR